MVGIFKYLVYRDTPFIGGAELIAGFVNREDAIRYADQLQKESILKEQYFVKEVIEESE